MKKYLLTVFSFVIPFFVTGQALMLQTINFVDSNVFPVNIVPDTTATPLWQLGTTTKSFFCSDTAGCHAVMTDTLLPYPVNANNWFTIKIERSGALVRNPIIDIWHSYQTDSGKDGGVIEFSTDSGATWLNVVGGCVNGSFVSSITVDSFYTPADTLENGTPSFTGSGKRHSILDFFDCAFVKTTTPVCHFDFSRSFYLRFRFVSDTVADTLSGWKIDSIRIVERNCPGSVEGVNLQPKLTIMPNPAHNELGIIYSPGITNVTICDVVGQQVYTANYNENEVRVDVSALPPGFYFARINEIEVRRFVKE